MAGPERWGITLMLLRLDRDLTRQELAERSGVAEGTIRLLEDGRGWGRYFVKAGRLAEALGVRRARLFRRASRDGRW